MRVILWGTPVNHRDLQTGLEAIGGLEVVSAQSVDALARALPGAEVLLMPVRHYNARVAALLHEHRHTLKLLHTINAGYDAVLADPPPKGTIVASAGASLAPAIAEHVMALWLALGRHFDVTMANQINEKWDESLRGDLRVLARRTVLIYGHGAIGKQVAQRARAFGAHVIACRRSGGSDPHVDEMITPAQLDEALGRADRIVVSAPLTEETRGFFNAERFAKVKRGAYFVNVARGQIVDTMALVEALKSGIIGAAGLDVTEPEPLPAGHPLWHMPRVLITPHVSASDSNPLLAQFVVENMRRYLKGEALEARLSEFD